MLLRSGPRLGGGMVCQSIHDPPFRVVSETFINEIGKSKRKKSTLAYDPGDRNWGIPKFLI